MELIKTKDNLRQVLTDYIVLILELFQAAQVHLISTLLALLQGHSSDPVYKL